MRAIARPPGRLLHFLRRLFFVSLRSKRFEPRRPAERRRYWRPAALACLLLLAILVFLGSPITRHGSTRTAPNPHTHHWYQIGRASWYGSGFQGQPTASGQAFNMHSMTCAHRTLPLGSLVRVTNLSNQKSVVVLVNDRGPLVHNRIVDVSYAAARALGFRGTAHVRVQLIDRSPTPEEVASLTNIQENPRAR